MLCLAHRAFTCGWILYKLWRGIVGNRLKNSHTYQLQASTSHCRLLLYYLTQMSRHTGPDSSVIRMWAVKANSCCLYGVVTLERKARARQGIAYFRHWREHYRVCNVPHYIDVTFKCVPIVFSPSLCTWSFLFLQWSDDNCLSSTELFPLCQGDFYTALLLKPYHHHREDRSRPERPLYLRNRCKITNTCSQNTIVKYGFRHHGDQC